MDQVKEQILKDPGIPEYMKVGFRITDAHHRIWTKLEKSFLDFGTMEATPAEAEKAYPEKKEYLEYLLLMEAGLDSFLEAHPAPSVTGFSPFE